MYASHVIHNYVIHNYVLSEQSFFRFASKPKKGIRFLQEKQLLPTKQEEVAQLFHNDKRLNKTAIGDYLGEGDEWVPCYAIQHLLQLGELFICFNFIHLL